MNKFIDFAPKRPQSVVESHPVAIKKPAPRGVRMDFVRRPGSASTPSPQIKVKKTIQVSIGSKPISVDSKPVSKPTPQPASRPFRVAGLGPKPGVKPGMRPGPRPGVRPHVDPQMRPGVRPNSKPGVKPGVKPGAKPQARPQIRPQLRPQPTTELGQDFEEELLLGDGPIDDESLLEDDELSLALAGFADDDEESPSLIDKLSKEANDFEDELNALDELDEISDDLEAEIEDFVEEPKPIFKESKKPDAPDANKFSLGGRSPFLSSVRVEKRPLSGLASEEVKPLKSEVKTPIKNAYRAKIKQVFKDENKGKTTRRETTIISTPEPRGHTIGLAIAIILTIILGALIGSVIYLVFFQ